MNDPELSRLRKLYKQAQERSRLSKLALNKTIIVQSELPRNSRSYAILGVAVHDLFLESERMSFARIDARHALERYEKDYKGVE